MLTQLELQLLKTAHTIAAMLILSCLLKKIQLWKTLALT